MDILLAYRRCNDIAPKNVEQIACELFTSLFILQSEFKFRIVIEQPYWLYLKENVFKLSLIGPDEWQNDAFGDYVAECVLQTDMTWTLELGEQATQNKSLIEYIESKKKIFEKHLAEQTHLKQVLPVYDARLPFYQLVMASGLVHSLKISMEKSRVSELDFEAAKVIQLANLESVD